MQRLDEDRSIEQQKSSKHGQVRTDLHAYGSQALDRPSKKSNASDLRKSQSALSPLSRRERIYPAPDAKATSRRGEGTNGRGRPPLSTQLTTARDGEERKTRSRSSSAGGRLPSHASQKPSEGTTCSLTDSRDEIDEAIDRNISRMLNRGRSMPVRRSASAKGKEEDELKTQIVVMDPASGQPTAESPAFFTAKSRTMHCELDDPGVSFPYPRTRYRERRQGFISRLLACFGLAHREVHSGSGLRTWREDYLHPPSPLSYNYVSSQNSPNYIMPPCGDTLNPSAGPLRASLSEISPRRLYGGCSEINHLPAYHENVESEQYERHNTPTNFMGRINNTIGKNAYAGPNSKNHSGKSPSPSVYGWRPRHTRRTALRRENSLDSITANVSDDEGTTPLGSRLRTPIPGPQGQPLLKPSRMQHQGIGPGSPSPTRTRKIEAERKTVKQSQTYAETFSKNNDARRRRNGLETEEACDGKDNPMKKNSSEPTSGSLVMSSPQRAQREGHTVLHRSPTKYTKISLAELMRADEYRAAMREEEGKGAHMDPGMRHRQQYAGYLQRETQRRYIDSRAQRMGIQSVPTSPLKTNVGSVPLKAANELEPEPDGAGDLSSLNSMREASAPARSPKKSSSAPTSRCPSPMKSPRMTKAAEARKEATRRLLDLRRREEAARFAKIPKAKRNALQLETAGLSQKENASQTTFNNSMHDAVNKTYTRHVREDTRTRQNLMSLTDDNARQSGPKIEGEDRHQQNKNCAHNEMESPKYGLSRHPNRMYDGSDDLHASGKAMSSRIEAMSTITPAKRGKMSLTDISEEQLAVLQQSPSFVELLDKLVAGLNVDADAIRRAKDPSMPAINFAGSISDGCEDARDDDELWQLSTEANTFTTKHGESVLGVRHVVYNGMDAMGISSETNSLQSSEQETLDPDELPGGLELESQMPFSGRISPLLTSQKLISIQDAISQANKALGRHPKAEQALSAPLSPILEAGNETGNMNGSNDESPGSLLMQLLDMERSLTLEDLETLKVAIRREAVS